MPPHDPAPVRTIGLVGGMSWTSTALYYRCINERMETIRGAHRNAPSVLVTLEFDRLQRAAQAGRWDAIGEALVDAGHRLEAAGAHCIVLTANTAHALADVVSHRCRLPLLHIADAVGGAVRQAGLRRVGLVGTSHVLNGGFYRDALRRRFGIEVTIPEAPAIERLDRMIFEELSLGRIEPASRAELLSILASLRVDGVVIACTELPLLLDGATGAPHCFDSTRLHAQAAVDFALEGA